MQAKSESGTLGIDLVHGGRVVPIKNLDQGNTMEYSWAFEQGGGNYTLAIVNLGLRPALVEISLWWQ